MAVSASLRGCSIFRHFLPSLSITRASSGAYKLPWLSGPGHTHRHLYTPAALGLEDYLRLRQDTSRRFAGIEGKFKERMRELLSSQDSALIFTEDFKNVLHLAEGTEDNLGLVREMARRFNQQNQGLRFGMYVFGPVVMRTYHTLKQPQEALEALSDPLLVGFFDQITTYQLAMDLLYEEARYPQVLQVFEQVQDRRIGGVRYPKICLSLAVAACYKMGSQDSLRELQGLLAKTEEYGIALNRRLLVFGAALALSTGHPHIALDFILRCTTVTHITVRSIKVMALSQMGRVDDALLTLRAITEIDQPRPSRANQGLYILREAVSAVETAVRDRGRPEELVELKRIVKCLEEGGAVSAKTLDEVVCQPIDKYQQQPRQDRAMLQASFYTSKGPQPRAAPPRRNPRRQGLMDRE